MKIYWNGTSKNIVGSKIRQLRQSKGLSQATLAGQLQLLGMECSDLRNCSKINYTCYF